MKLYLVEYEGMWLGGKAIVWAKDEVDALLFVKQHPRTVDFAGGRHGRKPSATELPAEGVVYNDNGDY